MKLFVLFIILTTLVYAQCNDNQLLIIIERQYKENCINEYACLWFAIPVNVTEGYYMYGSPELDYQLVNYYFCVDKQKNQQLSIGARFVDLLAWRDGSTISLRSLEHCYAKDLFASYQGSSLRFDPLYQNVCQSNQFHAYILRSVMHHGVYDDYKLYKGTNTSSTPIFSNDPRSLNGNLYATFDICLDYDTDYTMKLSRYNNEPWADVNDSQSPSVAVMDSECNFLLPPVRQPYYAPFTIAFSSRLGCADNQIPVIVARQYSTDADYEDTFIFKGFKKFGEAVWSIYGVMRDSNKLKTYTVCLEMNTQYTLNLHRLYYQWKTSSYVTLSYLNTTLVDKAGSVRTTDMYTPFDTSILPHCNADGVWYSTVTYRYSVIPCEQGYLGTRKRFCNGTTFDDVIYNCILQPPSQFEYGEEYFTYGRGTNVTILPTYIGAELLFTIQPSLPNGLSFDTSTGIISGIPSDIHSATLYTVTCSNSLGELSTTFSLEIILPSCEPEGMWPLTLANSTISLPCSDPINYEGNYSRYCIPGEVSIWDTVVDTCVLKLATIQYPTTSIILYKYYSMTSITPVISGGLLSAISISPSLPSELSFDSVTGKISGTPGITHVATIYTITISNSRNTASALLTIEISAKTCPQTGEWPETEASVYAIINCTDPINYSGYQKRYCNRYDIPEWGYAYDYCVLIPPQISYPVYMVTGFCGEEISIIPDILKGGNLNPITISPALPYGLILNDTTGTITGIPTIDTNLEYVITISNPSKRVQTQVKLQIQQVYCVDNDWPMTIRGHIAYVYCPDGLLGVKRRACDFNGSGQAIWNAVDTTLCISYSVKDKPPFSYMYAIASIIINSISYIQMNQPENYEMLRNYLHYQFSKNTTLESNDIIIISIEEKDSKSALCTFRVMFHSDSLSSINFSILHLQQSFTSQHPIENISCPDSVLCSITSIQLTNNNIQFIESSNLTTLILIISIVCVIIIIAIIITVVIILMRKRNNKHIKSHDASNKPKTESTTKVVTL